MALTKTTIRFSLAILAATAAISTVFAQSDTVDFCDTANDKALCAQLIKEGETWAEAMTNALNGVMKKAKAGKSIAYSVGGKLPPELQPQTKESIDKTCHQAYDNIIDNINQCIGFVKNDPFSSLKTYLSATNFSDCTDGLTEFNVSLPEVTEFDKEMLKLSSTLLSVAGKKP